jgi:hypothetical protein
VSSILGLVLNYKHLVVFHQKLNISLYMYKKGYVTIFLLIYVDDIIVTSSSPSAIDALLTDLKSKFAITNLGSLHYFLGIEVKWTCDVLCYLKKKYTTNLLHKVGMLACKLVATPMSTSEKLSAHVGDPLSMEEVTKYQSVVDPL